MPRVLVPKEILVGFQMSKMGRIKQHDTESKFPDASMETDMAKNKGHRRKKKEMQSNSLADPLLRVVQYLFVILT